MWGLQEATELWFSAMKKFFGKLASTAWWLMFLSILDGNVYVTLIAEAAFRTDKRKTFFADTKAFWNRYVTTAFDLLWELHPRAKHKGQHTFGRVQHRFWDRSKRRRSLHVSKESELHPALFRKRW